MALVEGCKHQLEISVPVSEVEQESEKVLNEIQKKVRLPGFRPGKAPRNVVRSKFGGEIRQDVLENLVPKAFRREVEKENLQVVSSPDVSDVHFHPGEPLRFKVTFEVAPVIELGEYRGVEVPYSEPEVTDEQVMKRIEEIREQKADYVNIDPRPVVDGDFAVVSLESISGVDKPVKNDEMMLHVGDEGTLKEFSEALRGMSPDEEKEFDVVYPEDYDRKELAGKTVRFRARLKVVRKKELPELNDEFAKDLGDYQNFEELKEAVRKALSRDAEFTAQQEAKGKIIDKLVDAHDFPIPEAFIDRQIEVNLETQLRQLAGQGIDPRKLNIDWAKLKESQTERAKRDVKASLLLERIADREAIDAMRDEVDNEVTRIARQRREPVAAVRAQLEKDGSLRRIASHIRTEKTLSFLFENARKTA
ncbi:MAG: trigger factor [Bryobacteraceae bacterium]|nr:trigger factor [Bryobacteraceae bacterium]